MGKCEYRAYYDNNVYTCSREKVAGSRYCIFHDKNFWERNENKVEREFERYLENCIENNKPLEAIGFHLPVVIFPKNEINIDLYFNKAKIHHLSFSEKRIKHVNLSDAKIGFLSFEDSKIINFFSKGATIDVIESLGGSSFNNFILRSSKTNQIMFLSDKFKTAQFLLSEINELWFDSCEFEEYANFEYTRFLNECEWSNIKFRGFVNFKFTELRKASFMNISFEKFATFYGAKFGDVRFIKTDLSNVVLANTQNLDKIQLVNISWKTQKQHKNHIIKFIDDIFKNQRIQIFEERLLLEKNKIKEEIKEKSAPIILNEEFNLTLEEVLATYRMLRDNYERRGDYETAGRLFVSEMELKRILRDDGKKKSWIGRNLSPSGLYKWLALYGESYIRPIIWSVFVISTFAFLRRIMNNNEDLKSAFINSFLVYLQTPPQNNLINSVERAISIILVALLFIALRRKLERKYRY